MATRAQIDATLERYYDAWTRNDPEQYATVWTEDATFADPPGDDEGPPVGIENIVAAMADVQSRAESISYWRAYTWHCGHSVAVHSVVTMQLPEGVAQVPLVHVFRFAEDARIRRLEAFLDFDLITMSEGQRPAWMPTQ